MRKLYEASAKKSFELSAGFLEISRPTETPCGQKHQAEVPPQLFGLCVEHPESPADHDRYDHRVLQNVQPEH